MRIPGTVKQKPNYVTEIRSCGSAVLRSSAESLSAGAEIMSSFVEPNCWNVEFGTYLEVCCQVFSSSAVFVGFSCKILGSCCWDLEFCRWDLEYQATRDTVSTTRWFCSGFPVLRFWDFVPSSTTEISSSAAVLWSWFSVLATWALVQWSWVLVCTEILSSGAEILGSAAEILSYGTKILSFAAGTFNFAFEIVEFTALEIVQVSTVEIVEFCRRDL